ncbi:MAG: DNA repair protein RecO [Bacteroidetes bacterium]|nr:DNA repair protein RecO [Bacteroidota bacterium]
MIIKTRGIVFRHQRYGETSVITDIYTEEKGLQSYIISGVRKKRSRVSSSLLQLMSLVDLVAYFREDRQKLNRIKEIRPAVTYQSIPFDLIKGTVGMFMIEVARKSIMEEESNTKLFEFLFTAFKDLDDTKNSVANYHLGFLLELTAYLGFMPAGDPDNDGAYFDLREGSFEPQKPEYPEFMEEKQGLKFYELLAGGYKNSHAVKLDRLERRQMLRKIIDYYRLHIEHFPEIKSMQILEEVLS